MNMQDAWNTPKPVTALDAAIMQRLANERLPQDKDGLLMLWDRTKATLETAKNDEMAIRKLVVQNYVPEPKAGVNNVDLGNGYLLKATVKYNYNLRKPSTDYKGDVVDAVDEAIDKITSISHNEGPFIAARLFNWKVDISVAEYKKLQEDALISATSKAMLDVVNTILEIKDAAPSLEIKEPKTKK